MTDTATTIDQQAPAHAPPAAMDQHNEEQKQAAEALGPAPSLQIPRAGEEATILFGSKPSRLFDAISEKIDAALRDGVATLPFLEPDGAPSSGGRASLGGARMSLGGGGGGRASLGSNATTPPPDEKLLSIIRNTYGANLDLAEAYAGRNVFALPVGTGPKRREEIVTAYLTAASGGTAAIMAGTGKENASNPNDDAIDTTNNTATTTTTNKPAYQIPPNKEAVPTSAQAASLDEETAQLRRRLRAARRMRSDLRSIVKDMGQTHAVAVTAKRTIDESCIGGGGVDGGNDDDGAMKIRSSVAAAVAGREDLAALTASGKDLLTKLDEEKEARRTNGNSNGDDDDDDGVVDLMESGADAAAETSKPLTIEEDMERRRKLMRTGEKDGLAKVSALLKER